MEKSIVRLTLLVLLLLGMIACSQEGGLAQSDEFVPGTKRWAGPYNRISQPSREPIHALGTPDVTITIDVVTSEFKPDIIRVKQNQVVKLILKGGDDGDLPKITGLREFSGHGFHVLGPYDIWITGLRTDVVREIVFKATAAGEFDIECPVFCSVNHYKMRGKLIVEPV